MLVKFKTIGREDINDVGLWLDQYMPNPPLPDPQRWTIKSNWEIEFVNDVDATRFLLVWE